MGVWIAWACATPATALGAPAASHTRRTGNGRHGRTSGTDACGWTGADTSLARAAHSTAVARCQRLRRVPEVAGAPGVARRRPKPSHVVSGTPAAVPRRRRVQSDPPTTAPTRGWEGEGSAACHPDGPKESSLSGQRPVAGPATAQSWRKLGVGPVWWCAVAFTSPLPVFRVRLERNARARGHGGSCTTRGLAHTGLYPGLPRRCGRRIGRMHSRSMLTPVAL